MRKDILIRLFVVVQLVLVIAIAAAGRSSAQEASPETAGSIEIFGAVGSQLTLSLADIQALPSETVEVDYRADDGTDVHHSYTGVRLWDVMQLVQPAIDPQAPESSLYLYLVLTAKDGYVVVLSMGEIDPEFGGQPILLAWNEDDQALSEEYSPFVLVTPGDQTEGRYIHGIVSIEVRSAIQEAAG